MNNAAAFSNYNRLKEETQVVDFFRKDLVHFGVRVAAVRDDAVSADRAVDAADDGVWGEVMPPTVRAEVSKPRA